MIKLLVEFVRKQSWMDMLTEASYDPLKHPGRTNRNTTDEFEIVWFRIRLLP